MASKRPTGVLPARAAGPGHREHSYEERYHTSVKTIRERVSSQALNHNISIAPHMFEENLFRLTGKRSTEAPGNERS